MSNNWINWKNLEIIEILRKDLFRGIPLAEIEKRLSLSHHPTYRRIRQLEKNNIIVKKEGNYRLNLNYPFSIETLYFLSRLEKLEFISSFKNDLFRILEKQFERYREIDIALLFGSYARKEQKKTSDLDIFIISEKRHLDKSFEAMYNVKSSIIFATKEEFVKMIKERKMIIKDLFNESIALKGNIYTLLEGNYEEW